MSVKSRFVQTILSDEGNRLLKNQGLTMQRKLEFHTYRLYQGRTKSVKTGAEMDGALTLQHTAYQRFLDLKQMKYGSKVVKRNRRIHNRFVFGHYSSIASRLMYDLTDEVVARIRGQINQ